MLDKYIDTIWGGIVLICLGVGIVGGWVYCSAGWVGILIACKVLGLIYSVLVVSAFIATGVIIIYNHIPKRRRK